MLSFFSHWSPASLSVIVPFPLSTKRGSVVVVLVVAVVLLVVVVGGVWQSSAFP